MSEFCIQNISLLIFLPLWLCLIFGLNTYLGISQSKGFTAVLSTASSAISILVSFLIAKSSLQGEIINYEAVYSWFKVADVNFFLGFYLDKLAVFALLFLFLITFFTQVFAIFFIDNETRFNKFVLNLNFLSFGVIGIVISPNLLQTLMFLMVTSCGVYLLLSGNADSLSRQNAAKRVFLWNLFGDFSFLAVVVAILYFGLNYGENYTSLFLSTQNIPLIADNLYSITTEGTYFVICAFLLLAVFIKGALFPFSAWFAKSAESETTSLMLLNTVLTPLISVFLLVRLQPIWFASENAIKLIFVLGALSALIYGFFALAKSDIKKIFAYSTASLLGLVFVYVSLGFLDYGIYKFGMQTLSKALMIACFGVTIISAGKEKTISASSWVAIVYFSSIMGVSGFFIRDILYNSLIYSQVYSFGDIGVLFVLVTTSILTVLYLFRSYFLLFPAGAVNSEKEPAKVPQAFFWLAAFLITILLYVGYSPVNFLANFNHTGFFAAFFIPFVSFVASIVIFKNFEPKPKEKENKAAKVEKDILYLAGKSITNMPASAAAWAETYLIEGIYRLVEGITGFFAWLVEKLRTSEVQNYAFYAIVFLFLVSAFCLLVYFVAGGAG